MEYSIYLFFLVRATVTAGACGSRGGASGVRCQPGLGSPGWWSLSEVDLKGAAKVSGNKKIDTVPLKDLTPLTGYIRGGCSPLGLKKNFPIFIHETAMQFPFIYVSAGERGLQLKVAPADLVKATRATVGVIARVPPEAPVD